MKATVIFTPLDVNNYETIEKEVEIQVQSKPNSLTFGGIIGIVISALILIAGISILINFLSKRNKQQNNSTKNN